MHSRIPFLKWFCAVVLISLMVASGGVSQATTEASRLERVRSELADIRKKLQAAKGQAASVRKQVSSLDRQIAELNRQILSEEKGIAGLESEIRSAQARIVELQAEHSSAIEASNERARRLYMNGPGSFFRQVFSVKSIGELTRMTVWWRVAAEMDGKVMLTANRLRYQLEDQTEQLAQSREALGSRKNELEERKVLIARARVEKASALNSLQRQIDDEERHLKALEQESKALTAAIRSSLSRSSGAVSRSGFIWPLNGRVTSGYGSRRGGFHSGIDIDGNTGDPIIASKAGSIAGISCGSGYGICTVIDHGGGVATLYAHMSRKAVSGGSVERGQVIGYVGCTGSCYGSHLHFEVRVNGEPQNPMNFLP